jgi:hypothetical protein
LSAGPVIAFGSGIGGGSGGGFSAGDVSTAAGIPQASQTSASASNSVRQ